MQWQQTMTLYLPNLSQSFQGKRTRQPQQHHHHTRWHCSPGPSWPHTGHRGWSAPSRHSRSHWAHEGWGSWQIGQMAWREIKRSMWITCIVLENWQKYVHVFFLLWNVVGSSAHFNAVKRPVSSSLYFSNTKSFTQSWQAYVWSTVVFCVNFAACRWHYSNQGVNQ